MLRWCCSHALGRVQRLPEYLGVVPSCWSLVDVEMAGNLCATMLAMYGRVISARHAYLVAVRTMVGDQHLDFARTALRD